MKRVAVLCMIILILQTGREIQAEHSIDMLTWKKVDTLLPKYTKFTVMDLDTGKKFHVQRRAGSHHADVQPLTAKDTAIMKSIYGGQWSWDRRAIVIIYQDRRIAASMHGMPHGAGALENNFPGHFCIHFYGSTTHRTRSMDLAHKLMILKAAGKLEIYLGKANPYEVIEAYVEGLRQKDAAIVSEISLQKLKWKSVFKQVGNVRISRLPQLPPEDLTNEIYLEVPVEMDWYLQNIGRLRFKGTIHMVRFSPNEPWRVDSISFLKKILLKAEVHRKGIFSTPA